MINCSIAFQLRQTVRESVNLPLRQNQTGKHQQPNQDSIRLCIWNRINPICRLINPSTGHRTTASYQTKRMWQITQNGFKYCHFPALETLGHDKRVTTTFFVQTIFMAHSFSSEDSLWKIQEVLYFARSQNASYASMHHAHLARPRCDLILSDSLVWHEQPHPISLLFPPERTVPNKLAKLKVMPDQYYPGGNQQSIFS